MLEAFNYCLEKKIDIINFSIGTTALRDESFADKVNRFDD
jgi:hypothetical protein